jgi:predicted MFS family arabinose efflux permease
VLVLPAVYVLGPVLADRELSGPSSWAIIVTCFGVGTIAGNLLALRLPLRRPVLVAALALVGACMQAAVIGSGLGTAGIAALELLAGVAVSMFFVLWDTSLQEQVPAHSVSRVSSYDFTVSLGLMPIGMAAAGPISAAIGLHATLLGMSALGVLVALAWLAMPAVRRVRRSDPGEWKPGPAVAAGPAVDGAAVARPTLGGGPDEPRFARDRDPV